MKNAAFPISSHPSPPNYDTRIYKGRSNSPRLRSDEKNILKLRESKEENSNKLYLPLTRHHLWECDSGIRWNRREKREIRTMKGRKSQPLHNKQMQEKYALLYVASFSGQANHLYKRRER